jgi:hypothetical protein
MVRTICITVIGIVLATTFGPPQGVERVPCERTFREIAKGMTRNQAIYLIGAPPGDYRSDTLITYGFMGNLIVLDSCEYWFSDDATIAICFIDDQVERVIWFYRHDLRHLRPSLWQRLLDNLGL